MKAAIKAINKAGETTREIAQTMGISQQRVSQVIINLLGASIFIKDKANVGGFNIKLVEYKANIGIGSAAKISHITLADISIGRLRGAHNDYCTPLVPKKT